MSNERHETVSDNVSVKHQFREVAKMIPHEEVSVSEMQQSFQPVTDCHGLNAAKMREALLKASVVLNEATHHNLTEEYINECLALIYSALSDQPRNCDVLSDTQEALAAIHEDRCYVNNPTDERRLTVEWLFAEAKGDAK